MAQCELHLHCHGRAHEELASTTCGAMVDGLDIAEETIARIAFHKVGRRLNDKTSVFICLHD